MVLGDSNNSSWGVFAYSKRRIDAGNDTVSFVLRLKIQLVNTRNGFGPYFLTIVLAAGSIKPLVADRNREIMVVARFLCSIDGIVTLLLPTIRQIWYSIKIMLGWKYGFSRMEDHHQEDQ